MARMRSCLFIMLAGLAVLDGVMAQNRGYLATLEANPNHKMMVAMAFNKIMMSYGIKDASVAMKNSTLTNMLMNEVLMLHVVQGKVITSSSFTKGATFPTLKRSGSNFMQLQVTVDATTKKTYIKAVGPNVGPRAQIVKKDQIVLNPKTGQTLGVIHDISGVLLPDVRIKL